MDSTGACCRTAPLAEWCSGMGSCVIRLLRVCANIYEVSICLQHLRNLQTADLLFV